MEDLALKIRKVDNVIIRNPDSSYSGSSQVKGGRRTEAPGANTKYRGLAEGELTLLAKGRQGQMSLVTGFFAFG